MCGTTARVQTKTPLRLTLMTASNVASSIIRQRAVLPLHELRVAHDAGVVDQDVDAAVLRDDVIDGALRPARGS